MGRRQSAVTMRLLLISVVALAFLGAVPAEGKAAATTLGATGASHPTVTAATTTAPAGAAAEEGSTAAAGSSPVSVAVEAVTSAFLSAARVLGTVVKTTKNLVSPTPPPTVPTVPPATTHTLMLATEAHGDGDVATSTAMTMVEKEVSATVESVNVQTSSTMRGGTEKNPTMESVNVQTSTMRNGTEKNPTMESRTVQSSVTKANDTEKNTTTVTIQSMGVKRSASLPKETEQNSTPPSNGEPKLETIAKSGDATMTGMQMQTMNVTTKMTTTTQKIEATTTIDTKLISTASSVTESATIDTARATPTMKPEMKIETQTSTIKTFIPTTTSRSANQNSAAEVKKTEVKEDTHITSSTSVSEPPKVSSTSESIEARDLPLDEELNETLHTITYAANSFASDLYEVARKKSGNLIISPLSANIILALTALGARENTAKQLVSALHLPQELQRVSEGYKSLLDALHVTDEVILTIANKLYVQQFFPIKDSFRSIAEDHFKSEIDNLDFTNQSDIARETINQWVEVHTEGVIRDLFEEGTPSKDTFMVLVNTVYLKAGWEKPFEESLTKNGTFYLSHGSKITVPMMQKPFSELPYCDVPDLNAKFLVLPFEDEIDNESDEAVLRMIIILPYLMEGLQDLEGKIKNFNISSVDFESREVNLTMPKFKIEAKHDFKQTLEQLGITDLFSRKANLSGIVGDAPIYVNKVIQKTSIDVNENGTEITTATGNEFMFYSSPPPRADFLVDHPFLFCIMHRNLILFMGRVIDPRT